jgi:hypothetical protein
MMPSPRPADRRVAALLSAHGGRDPELVIASLCRGLLLEAGALVPVNVEVLASYRRATVEVVDQEQAETIVWDGRRWVIRIRRLDTHGRQRFSCAHAVVHTFFMEAETLVASPTTTGRTTSWSADEEHLCDLGAAELLLPRERFVATCPPRPTMDDVLRLAATFEASAEATALRAVTLAPVPAAMVVLEPSLKPAELRTLARYGQPALPGMAEGFAPMPRLRVQKSMGKSVPFIAKHKSVDDASPLAAVLSGENVDYVGPTGLVCGEFRVSARLLPVRRHGAVIDRVVAIFFDDARETSVRSRRSN